MVRGTATDLRTENGQVSFRLLLSSPPQPSAREAGCPNDNWTATIVSVDYIRATIKVFQGGDLVLQRSFEA